MLMFYSACKKRFSTQTYTSTKSPPFVHSLNRTYDSCCNIYNPIKLMHVYWVAKKANLRGKEKGNFLSE